MLTNAQRNRYISDVVAPPPKPKWTNTRAEETVLSFCEFRTNTRQPTMHRGLGEKMTSIKSGPETGQASDTTGKGAGLYVSDAKI